MAFYRICPDCGATLDPGEKCNCREEEERKQAFFSQNLKMEPRTSQFAFVFGKAEKSYGEGNSY